MLPFVRASQASPWCVWCGENLEEHDPMAFSFHVVYRCTSHIPEAIRQEHEDEVLDDD